jgi:IclR family transcriptional regulator, pca regulon regulatory protein
MAKSATRHQVDDGASTKGSAQVVRREGDPDYMQSLARGLEVIRAFEHARPTLSITAVARLTNISRAAARRCLYTLAQLGYVSGSEGIYELTPRILSLGYAYLSAMPLARIAQPVLERISDRLHESCSIAVLDGDEIVYVARAATQRILSIGLGVGSRLPAYCTSMGRMLLAYLNDSDLDAYLARVTLQRHTQHTITDKSVLRKELQRVRTAGYVMVDQELEMGLRSIAVPVKQPDGRAVASINVGAHAARADRQMMVKTYLPVLLEAANEIGLAVRR